MPSARHASTILSAELVRVSLDFLHENTTHKYKCYPAYCFKQVYGGGGRGGGTPPIPPTAPTHNTSLPYRHTIQAYRTDTQYKLTVPTHNTSLPYRHTIQAYHTDTLYKLAAPSSLAHGSDFRPVYQPRFTIGPRFTGLATSPGLPRGQLGEGPGLPRGQPRFTAKPRFSPGLAPVYLATRQ